MSMRISPSTYLYWMHFFSFIQNASESCDFTNHSSRLRRIKTATNIRLEVVDERTEQKESTFIQSGTIGKTIDISNREEQSNRPVIDWSSTKSRFAEIARGKTKIRRSGATRHFYRLVFDLRLIWLFAKGRWLYRFLRNFTRQISRPESIGWQRRRAFRIASRDSIWDAESQMRNGIGDTQSSIRISILYRICSWLSTIWCR